MTKAKLLQGGGGSGEDISTDTDYRQYTMQETYDEVNLKAGLCVAGFSVIMVIVVLLRDVFQVWTCFGERASLSHEIR
jgi:hypothetical protein